MSAKNVIQDPASLYYLYFEGLPNDIILGCMFLSTLLVSMATFFIIQCITLRPGAYTEVETRIGVRGLRFMQMIGLVGFILLGILLGRAYTTSPYKLYYPPGTYPVGYTDSFSQGDWVKVRVGLGALAYFSLFMYDAHWVMRMTCVILFPLLASSDFLSELALVRNIQCVEYDVCPTKTGPDSLTQMKFYAIRDILSGCVNMYLSFLSLWLTAYFGYFTNDICLTNKEHRALARSLDAVVGTISSMQQRQGAKDAALYRRHNNM